MYVIWSFFILIFVYDKFFILFLILVFFLHQHQQHNILQNDENEFIIKLAGKGSVGVVMMPKYYWTMYQSHLNKQYYWWLLKTIINKLIINEEIINYTSKYKYILTDNEYEYLINLIYKISDLYKYPNLHKSKESNEIIKNKNAKYININEKLTNLTLTSCCRTSLLHK